LCCQDTSAQQQSVAGQKKAYHQAGFGKNGSPTLFTFSQYQLKHRRIALAIGVAKSIFIGVVLEVFRIAVPVHAINATLELAPKVLNVLGMHAADYIFLLAVVNRFVLVTASLQQTV
jgi:hypothetical protein